MAKEIKIFNPRDKPFGCLSNNYSNYVQGDKQQVSVIQNLKFGNGKPCKTLTNYIYASLLQDGSYKQIVCNAKKAKDAFHEQAIIEENNKISEAVKEALKKMFEQNTDLANLLLSTGDRKLLYMPKNGDTFLGISQIDKQGHNWYGFYLQQERKRLFDEIKTQKTKKDKEKEENIKYDTFLAEKALTDAIQRERGGDDLKKYIGRSLDQILQEFGGRETLESKFKLSRNLFLTSFQKRVSEQFASYVLNPTNMVLLIRKQFLHQLKTNKLKELKRQIFSMYADYLLAKKGVSSDDFEKAKEEQFSGKYYFDNINNLEDRLYNLYNKGMLSERLSENIDEVKKSYHIPTDKEIDEAKKYQPPVKKDIDQPDKYVTLNTDPIYILPSNAERDEMYTKNAKYVCLSPDSVCKHRITINGFIYLTVNHYIIEKLMLRLGVKNVHSSYILDPSSGSFRNLPDIVKDYEKLKSKFYKDKSIEYAKEGLKKKFSNRVMQDYLLATGDANLIYDDRKDSVLGSGPDDKGDNEVGKYLMKLRTKFAEERNKEEFNLLTPADIKLVMNAFMKDWVTQKVKDSCRTIVTINDYVKKKFDTEVSLSPKFVETVLDNIYHPCSQIYGAVDQIKFPAPEYFVSIVTNCVGMDSASSEIIDVLWKRIAVIIYYLIIHLGEKGVKIQDISSEIGHVQVLKSQKISCENIVSDEYENCIIVALVNLIIGIINFNRLYGMPKFKVSEVEVETATSIILESIIPKKLPKKDDEEIVEGVKDPKDGKEVGEDLTEDHSSFKYPYGEEDDDLTITKTEYDPKDYEKLIEENEKDLAFLSSDSSNENNDYDSEGSFSPQSDKINNIVEYLKGFEQIKADDIPLATYINQAVTIIKNETGLISEQIKRNRVNFFSGHK